MVQVWQLEKFLQIENVLEDDLYLLGRVGSHGNSMKIKGSSMAYICPLNLVISHGKKYWPQISPGLNQTSFLIKLFWLISILDSILQDTIAAPSILVLNLSIPNLFNSKGALPRCHRSRSDRGSERSLTPYPAQVRLQAYWAAATLETCVHSKCRPITLPKVQVLLPPQRPRSKSGRDGSRTTATLPLGQLRVSRLASNLITDFFVPFGSRFPQGSHYQLDEKPLALSPLLQCHNFTLCPPPDL